MKSGNNIAKAAGIGIPKGLLGMNLQFLGENSGSQFNSLIGFKGDAAINNFGKHSKEIMDTLRKDSYNLKEYVQDANYIIRNGRYTSELNGYISFFGGKGNAKFGFVGLDRATGRITTFHIKTARELSRKAPSLGIFQ